MSSININRRPTNFTKLPLAFCNGFTLKKAAFWNRHPILQAGTTINKTIIDFYHDIAMSIPVSVRMDQASNRMEAQLIRNITEYKQHNANKERLNIELSDGEILMEEGDTSNQDCFILVTGILSVNINGVSVANISDQGMPVGEMSFLTGEPRSATVIAKGSTSVLRLPKQDKSKVLRSNPTICMTILEALVSRLADNNKKLVTLSEKMKSDSNKAIVKAEKLEQSYHTVVNTLLQAAGIKKGNLEVLEKMLQVLEENLGTKLESKNTSAVYKMFLDFVEYFRQQSINENVESIIFKENMSDLMRQLF